MVVLLWSATATNVFDPPSRDSSGVVVQKIVQRFFTAVEGLPVVLPPDWFFVPRNRAGRVIALLGEILQQQAAGHSVLAEFRADPEPQAIAFRQLDALCLLDRVAGGLKSVPQHEISQICVLQGDCRISSFFCSGRMRSDIRLFWPIAARGMASPFVRIQIVHQLIEKIKI